MDTSIENRIFIYPTDTVWGIGSGIHQSENYQQICKIKKITPGRPFSLLFSSLDMICEYINIPGKFNLAWLQKFFQLETTICIPEQFIQNKMIPKWIYQGSDLVGIRCLELDFFVGLTDLVKGPILSTSLNLTNHNPITNLKDAIEFKNNHAPDAEIWMSNGDPVIPSGHSSTVISLDLKGNISTIRKGIWYDSVAAHLGLLST